MKYKFIKQNNSTSLAVLFTGWGFTPDYYEKANISCDFVVIYDYIDVNLDTSFLKGYSNIYLFAWSFGVYEAGRFFSENKGFPIVFSMAINGTMFPIDDINGIPEKIFKGTYNNLSEKTLSKFYLRMCGNLSSYKDFLKNKPESSINHLKEELLSVYNQTLDNNSDSINLFNWDVAVLCSNDNIFPYSNQLSFWNNRCENIIVFDYPHLLPSLVSLINSRIIDKQLIKKRFSKIIETYPKEALPQNVISNELFRKWVSVDFKSHKSILEIGCGTGFLTKLYADIINPSKLFLNDLCKVDLNIRDSKYTFLEGDAEALVTKINYKFDYILSSSAIQWFENIPLFLMNLRKILNKGGFLILSTFGNRNLEELRPFNNYNSLNYLSVTELNNLLNKDFDIFYIVDDILKFNFDNPIDILHHLKLTGVNCLRTVNSWTKYDLSRFIDNFPKNKQDNRYTLTYHPIYIVARLK